MKYDQDYRDRFQKWMLTVDPVEPCNCVLTWRWHWNGDSELPEGIQLHAITLCLEHSHDDAVADQQVAKRYEVERQAVLRKIHAGAYLTGWTMFDECENGNHKDCRCYAPSWGVDNGGKLGSMRCSCACHQDSLTVPAELAPNVKLPSITKTVQQVVCPVCKFAMQNFQPTQAEGSTLYHAVHEQETAKDGVQLSACMMSCCDNYGKVFEVKPLFVELSETGKTWDQVR